VRLASQTFDRRLAQIRADRCMTRRPRQSRQAITHWENDPFFGVRLSDAQACPEAPGGRLCELLAPLDAPTPCITPLRSRIRKASPATCRRNVQKKASAPGALARDPKLAPTFVVMVSR
jgi:hypothetical protein